MTRPLTRRHWIVRLSIGLAPALALALSAPPAQAEEDAHIYVNGTSLTIGTAPSPGKTTLLGVGTHRAKNPTIVLDLSSLVGVATTAKPDGCTQAGPIITCPLPEGEYQDTLIPLDLRPASGAVSGAFGWIKWRTEADNVAEAAGQLAVHVKDGVDLVATSPYREYLDVKPGAEVRLLVSGVNLGSRSTPGVSLTVVGFERMQLAQYDGCQYSVEYEVQVALCELAFDPPLAPGESFHIIDGTSGLEGFGLIVAPDAHEEAPFYIIQPSGEPAALPNSVKMRTGTGGKLEVKRVPAGLRAAGDIDEQDNSQGARVVVETTADVAAKGSNVSGAVGSEVEVVVGARNLGPATLDAPDANHAVSFIFAVPPGTSVTKVSKPEDCYIENGDSFDQPFEPGKPSYACLTERVLKAGTEWTATFTLKINEVIPNAKGQVRIKWSGNAPDQNQANNVADVLVNPQSDNGGNGGTLPITGVQAGVIGGVGAAVLALGAVLFFLARRRRVVLVTGEDHTVNE